MSIRQWKAAVCQSEPCWFDKDATIEKSLKLIREARSNGASLIAFSEVWVTATLTFSAYGDEMLRIRQAAAENNIYVVFGFSERVGASLYLAQMLINSEGNILLHRRKPKPTHVERTIFGDSTGDSLTTVVDTPLGKIGMLNCWEHLQPLLKYHTYSQGEQVHIAAWPFNGEFNGGIEPWSLFGEANELTASRSEGQGSADMDSFMLSGGGGRAAVFGPDGRQLTEPTKPTYDGLIYSDIDLDKIDYAKTLTDCVGNYSQPDLLRLVVDDQPKNFVTRVSSEKPTNSPYISTTGDETLLSTHKTLREILRAKNRLENSEGSVDVSQA
ncbi:hypothetical protein COL922a_010653 [Colletotrichum nupharicola]|nr:hypothetical protein COL922a_010653 [Colletotrichum nupharicola]